MLLKLHNAVQSLFYARCQKYIINHNSNSNRPYAYFISEFGWVKSARLNITSIFLWFVTQIGRYAEWQNGLLTPTAQRSAPETWNAHPSWILRERGHPLPKCWHHGLARLTPFDKQSIALQQSFSMKLCSRLLMVLVEIYAKNANFEYRNPIFGKLGVTHDLDHGLLESRDGPNVRLWHSAEAGGLGRLTERVPNVRPKFGRMLYAKMNIFYWRMHWDRAALIDSIFDYFVICRTHSFAVCILEQVTWRHRGPK